MIKELPLLPYLENYMGKNPSISFKVTFITLVAMLFVAAETQAQTTFFGQTDRKGELFMYWGWNRSAYTNSDIHFTGDDYDFTLEKVKAADRQSDLSMDYVSLGTLTIPQFNFRIGYYINDKYSISFGLDHMKYVMVSNQTVNIDGNIENSDTEYDGRYDNEEFVVAEDFLTFEHTDGLNYTNIELRRLDNLFRWEKGIEINLTTGIGAAVMLPKTNAKLLSNDRHDDFNIAGYGFDAMVGLNITFFNYFFIQGELKGGFIHMPNVRTTQFKSDKASQKFMFGQSNIVIGAFIPLARNSKISKKQFIAE